MNFPRRLSLSFTLAIAATLCASLSACAQQPPAGTPTVVVPTPPPPLFTDAERAALVTYWCAPGRYKIAGAATATQTGPYVVRLTPEGSVWFHTYQTVVKGRGKTPPTEDAAAATTGATADWEPWVKAKLAFDRYQALQGAQVANLAVFPIVIPPVTPPPPVPGPIPVGLLAACGNPPRLAGVYAPLQYSVTFDDGDAYAYTDNVKLPDRYAYYRFASGVSTGGVKLDKMPDDERDALFKSTGFPKGEQHVWEGVSALEGGFDSVQTYDTGYVSVGFIQFVTMLDSKHDLTHALLQEKADSPAEYGSDFHRYGIDAYPDQTLVVVDPETGAELSGPDAVMKIVDDKRLLAIFQRAGRKTPFRLAQIKVAKQDYWPVNDPVVVTLPNGATLTGTVADVVHSEAGIATLLDRKINIGNCRIISTAVQNAMIAHKCPGKSLSEALPYEREIVAACKYRADYLKNAALTQPPAEAAAVLTTAAPANPDQPASDTPEKPKKKKRRFPF